MIEIITGIVTAVVVIIITRLLSKYFSAKLFAASILVAIAFIYVGFSLKDNPASLVALECGVALIFYFMALTGYSRNAILIAWGIILHGVWDIFHHKGFFIATDIPVFWPSYCLTVDIIDGVYFLIIFKKLPKSVIPDTPITD
jgi:hypothetical protein